MAQDIRERLNDAFGDKWRFDVSVTDYQSGQATLTGRLTAGGAEATASAELVVAPDGSAGDRFDRVSRSCFEQCAQQLLERPNEPESSPYFGRDHSDIDVVTRRVVGGAFNAIAREMAQVLYRMSNSSIIRESEDLGCGIFDAEGRELCESESSPMHIGSLPAYIRGFMQRTARKAV